MAYTRAMVSSRSCPLETGDTAELRSKECLQLPSATRELEPVESGCIQAISPHVPAPWPSFPAAAL